MFKLKHRSVPVMMLAGMFASSIPLPAQKAADSDKANVQVLMQEVRELRARVEKLEAEKAKSVAPQLVEAVAQAGQTTPQPTPELSPETEAPGEHNEMERMDPGKTLLRMRGFGDVTFHGDDHHGDTTSFTLGQLDLFITSDVSEKFRFLGEIVFEGDQNNNYGVDIERLLMQYAPKDWLNISVGRYHTAIGYYNTAYHHSTWLQTTTGRPFLFEFEDKGGILPVHNVGVSATGLIPSGSLGLHYIAEIGNGRSSRDPINQEAVQNVVDENNRKAVNLGLFVRPHWMEGLQAGVSIYNDLLQPMSSPRIGETIVAGHAVYVRPNFEWLNEAMVIRHAIHGGRTYQTPGFYSQFSKRFGSYRPYVRYQYLNVANTEPVFSDVGLRHGPSVGVRYDPTESVALKLQYDYTAQRNRDSFNGLAAQLGFTF
jgi:hypothetical protein